LQERQGHVRRTVRLRGDFERRDAGYQVLLEALRLGRLDRVAAVPVAHDLQQGDLERRLELVLGDHDRRVRTKRVPDAELVRDVHIRRREVGDDQLRSPETLVQRLVDHSRHDLVGPDALVSGFLCR
jgi:hypothetical protein